MGSVGSGKGAGGGIEIPKSEERIMKEEIDTIKNNTVYILNADGLNQEDLEYLYTATEDQMAYGDQVISDSIMLESIGGVLAGNDSYISIRLGNFDPTDLKKFQSILSKLNHSDQVVMDIDKLLQWYKVHKWPNK